MMMREVFRGNWWLLFLDFTSVLQYSFRKESPRLILSKIFTYWRTRDEIWSEKTELEKTRVGKDDWESKTRCKKSSESAVWKKGMGMINNPKKSVYNSVYSRTTYDALKMPSGSRTRSYSDPDQELIEPPRNNSRIPYLSKFVTGWIVFFVFALCVDAVSSRLGGIFLAISLVSAILGGLVILVSE